MQPSVGRIVHYSPGIGDPQGQPDPIPAIMTRVWSEKVVNLTVFFCALEPKPKTSVIEGEGPGQWRWPPIASR